MAAVDYFLPAAVALLACYLPCGWVAVTSETMDRLAALQISVIIAILEIMLLSKALAQPSFIDLALALALLSFPATLVFAYIIARWL
jgi:multicomponent Na+:H+ antiporter subunit F